MLKKSLNILFLVLGISLLNVSAQTDQKIKTISKGVVNGSAISLPTPVYPAAAKAVGAGGAVNVQVTIDEQGNVISASAVSGHPLLRQASEQAARAAKFNPTLLSGIAVKVTGVLVYNFVPPIVDGMDSDKPLPKFGIILKGDRDENSSSLPDKNPVLNALATDLVKPQYPAAARAVRASGIVRVKVTIDEEGNVISAEADSGHPLLLEESINAARASKFKSPSEITTGYIVYNFTEPTEESGNGDTSDKMISVGVVNGRAVRLVNPSYPENARKQGISGIVLVEVIIDENGNVISAKTTKGEELLREATEQAALKCKFPATLLDGEPAKVKGILVYNFTLKPSR